MEEDPIHVEQVEHYSDFDEEMMEEEIDKMLNGF